MNAHIGEYAEYKDSGVARLGRTPAHWRTAPLKRATSVNQLTLAEDTNPAYSFDYIDIGGVGTGRLLRKPERIFFSDSPSRARRIVHQGDTILSTVRTYLKATYTFAYPIEDVVASTGFAVLTPSDQLDSRYLGYAVQSDYLVDQVVANSIGIAYPAIAEARLGSLKLTIPPLDEQAAIVKYLAHVDRKIDWFIRAQRRMIELLHEQKQAIIHQAVTRGLDPSVPMKDSGVEWLGEIPAHWEDASLGQGSETIQTGPFGSQLHSSDYIEHGVPVINPSHLMDGQILANDKITVDRDTAIRLDRHRLRERDIVMGRRGELGRCAVVTAQSEGWLCGTGSLVIRPKQQLFNSNYLAHVIASPGSRRYLGLLSVGSTMDNLSAGIAARLRVPCPPIYEQQAIVTFINEAQVRLAKLQERASTEIELIREYRTRLISDVVTGKIDVRATAATLPEFEKTVLPSSWDDEFEPNGHADASELDEDE